MPYLKNEDLPPLLANFIADEKGKTIFRSAFNAAMLKNQPEENAFKIAWSALEAAGYKKDAQGIWREEVQQTDVDSQVVLEFAKQLGD
ncbi:MAG: ChaB family protein, partial [Methanothrix sp.]|nr:ChaB family protein [Methanothrix sp.]